MNHATAIASGKTEEMVRPLIGVSSRPRRPGEVSGWPDTPSAVMQNTYLEALWRAGGLEAVLAPRMLTDDDAEAIVGRLDGLILVGGGDVDPALYGAARHEHVYGVFAESDALEMALARAAVKLNRPLLAICRGMQVLNVALGGTLDQHLTGRDGLIDHGQPGTGPAVHDVVVEPGSLLAKTLGGAATIERCWSYHHQAIVQLGDGLTVCARSSDGVIEAVEFDNAADRSWTLGIQWHPERTAATDVVHQNFFDELVRQASDT